VLKGNGDVEGKTLTVRAASTLARKDDINDLVGVQPVLSKKVSRCRNTKRRTPVGKG